MFPGVTAIYKFHSDEFLPQLAKRLENRSVNKLQFTISVSLDTCIVMYESG